ncbi:programmed cell death protein 2 [Podospora didyma]|uniref:Programmed cell death protein 2 n=1 Tax=Podospora didyma TaxID=330526 RepID=A0AAE0U034_9PEZI|nr:programmed cell death protein 2 [Podospora didyma]
MVLLLQLNGELPEQFPGHERRIYIVSCRRKSCRRKEGSIRAIRGVKIAPGSPSVVSKQAKEAAAKEAKPAKEPVALPKASTLGLGESLFGGKPTAGGPARANPFASPSAGSNPFAPKAAGAANPFAKPSPAAAPAAVEPPKAVDATVEALPKTFAETLSLNNTQSSSDPSPPREPWPETDKQPQAYPVRWLADAEYEALDPNPPMPEQATSMEIDTADAGGSGGGKEDKEVYESAMDATFQKFADRVGQNPDQCIRYEFAGQPLLYSKGDAVGKLLHVSADSGAKVVTTSGKGAIPRCENCGAGRVFEVQLAPHAIEELELEEDELDGMEWGTIITGVCEKDCQERGVPDGEAGYLEEWVGVQWEELTASR